MSMSEVINSIEREMFDRTAKRRCGNCKWWVDNEVCVCDKSNEIADLTSKEFSCNRHEFKENEKNE